MLKNRISNIVNSKIFSSVEICSKNGETVYHVLIAKKSKDELVVESFESSDSLQKVVKIIGKNIPVIISINTDNVLSKTVDAKLTSSNEAVIDHTFPSINVSSFYFEIVTLKPHRLVSIVKRNYADKYLNEFKRHQLNIISIHIGYSSINKITNHFHNVELVGSNYGFFVDENHNSSKFEYTEKQREYQFGGVSLTNNSLLTFSSILAYLSPNQNSTNFDSLKKEFRTNFYNRSLYQKGIKISLVFFLIILLLNFFIYEDYREKITELDLTSQLNSNQLNKLKKLETEVLKKKDRVEILTATSNSKSTFYLDLLAKSVPTEILLSQLEFQPLLKPLRQSKEIELDKDIIIIIGTTPNGNHLSKWVAELEQLLFIKNVETVSYEYLSKASSKFTLKLVLHEA
ncbi:hypothetical protein [Cytophaga sp. FL35]|uniref:hypothetical protein n=1 Tax=Cytophaga sp. FL35 TaxID=1904456 RepID=UPI00165379F4|nr:hypothetical protein [Cytophaga sp. FL35]MBC6999651.1 hypothetical protein [Cytophaga sp. FL35]